MRPTLLIALWALSALGCGSSLKITVERYDMSDAATRAAYVAAHPPEPPILRELERFSIQLDEYGRQLVILNTARAQFDNLAAAEKDARGSCEAKRADVSPRVARALQPSKEIVTRAIASFSSLALGNRTISTAARLAVWANLERAWSELPKRLEAEKLDTDPGAFEAKTKKLAAVADNQTVTSRLVPVLECMRGASPATFERDLTAVVKKQGQLESQKLTKKAIEEFKSPPGDLVERVHTVYQDMSDPFLAYLAAHDEHWRQMPNGASVSGDGDTEFMLVFEDALDARWSSVSVDPEKVIRARLRIGRSVGGALAAVTGVAGGAYTIPVPATGDQAGAAPEKDFAALIAETEAANLENERLDGKLDQIADVANEESQRLSPEKPDPFQIQASRDRLLRYLQRPSTAPK